MIIAAKGAAAFSGATGLEYRWVSVGDSGELRTCDDTTGTTWTARTSSFGTTNISGIASNGTSLYVAVGADGKLATSPDGITWTQRTSSFGTDGISAVAYGLDGYWVAVGVSGKIATSTDGITWTQRTSGTTNWLYQVSFGNNLWVVTAFTTGFMITASDPTSTWTSRTSTITGVNFGANYDPGIGIWVVGRDSGTTGALASSTNGTSWTARTSTISAQQNPFISNYYLQVTVSNGSVIVGCTVTNWGTSPNPTIDFESSTNGTTWTNRTPADTTETISCAASDNLGNMMFAGSTAQVSSDGITWTKTGTTNNARGLCHSSGTESIR